MAKAGNRKKKLKFYDYNLLFIIIFLVAFGLLMLYSTSSYTAQGKFGDSFYYVKHQGAISLAGLVIMLVVSHIDYHIWYKLAPLAYIGSLGLCALVPVIGVEINHSKRWIKLAPGVTIQPSEIAKIGIIIFLAFLISQMPKKMGELKTIAKMFALVAPIIAFVAMNNLTTAVIMAGISVLMLFVASPKYKQFFLIGLGGVAFLSAFLFAASYRGDRLKIWLHPEDYEKGYQTLQGLYAIGAGGLFGKGLGGSLQKLGAVPEAMNDMIFCIICEELGLVGAFCVIVLFVLMLWRFMVIANSSSDLFGSLLVVGIMSHIALQVVLNIAVVTNSIPNTGVTLPFISYGGTSMLFLLFEMGLALSVSRGIPLESAEEE